MNKNIFLRVSVLLGVGLMGIAQANEYRSPLISVRGPLRHVFEEWDSEDYGLKLWADAYGREAHKAFIKHGTNTQPLTSLFFNKSDFRLTEAFPNSLVPLASEYYNPFVRVMSIHPRAYYTEKGITLGAKFAYPVYKDKGRLGVRVSVPFRQIEVEKQDTEGADDAQFNDLAISGLKTYLYDTNGDPLTDPDDGSIIETDKAFAIRWDFMEATIQNKEHQSFITYDGNGTNHAVTTGAKTVMNQDTASGRDCNTGGIIYCQNGDVPCNPDERLAFPYTYDLKEMPVNGVIAAGLENTYGFNWTDGQAAAYASWADDNAALTVAQRLDMQAKKADMWFVSANIPTDDAPGVGHLSGKAEDVRSTLFDELFNNYKSNSYEWMSDMGYNFDTCKRSGLGDIDLDLFYEHQFSHSFMGEIMAGVRFPTGGTDELYSSPYLVNLGNSDHWEVRFGGYLAWQPLDWMNIKLDAHYNFALEGTEHRCAAFSGAQIKNMGPKADADVSWSYLDAALDFNLFHPKTDAISLTLGYGFYYKTKDDVDFKNSTMQSWLGKILKNTGTDAAPVYTWSANPQKLDGGVAEQHTEAISHKVRSEASFRISKWFELFFGATYAFAGQNIPRETDCHGGFVVTF